MWSKAIRRAAALRIPAHAGRRTAQQESASLGGASAQVRTKRFVSPGPSRGSEATKQIHAFPIQFQTAQTVIASEAKQSIVPRKKDGLLRRFAPPQ